MTRRPSRQLVSDDISKPRYVWDPHVHQKLYGEDCSYFLLRLHAPKIGLIAGLESILRDVKPSSYCIYKLLGYYDALIRVWLTPAQRLRLIEDLDGKYSDAESLEEFRVASAFYGAWSVQRPNIPFRELLSHRADIEAVSRLGPLSEIPPDEAERLEGANLLHYLDPKAAFGADSADLVKLYIALDRPPGESSTITPEKEIAAIHASIADVPALRLPSIYLGDGFAEYLIKGMVNHFAEIDRSITELESAFRARGLTFRLLLLLIANSEVRESEAINVGWDETVQNLSRLTRLTRILIHAPRLTRDVAQQMTELSETERDQLRAIFERFSPVHLDTPFERFFFGLIEARIFGDHTQLAENLSFILHLEWLLKRHLIEAVWPKQLGRDWETEVTRLANRLSDEHWHGPVRAADMQSTADFTLGDCVEVMRSLVDSDRLSDEALATRLGPDWYAKLTQVLDLRQDVATGEFLDEQAALDRLFRWGDTAKTACEAGEVYNSLLA